VDRVGPQVSLCPREQSSGISNSEQSIAIFPILADVVEVKTGSRSTANWSNNFIRLNGWLRNCFAQLITPLDIDGIGHNWEESNTITRSRRLEDEWLCAVRASLSVGHCAIAIWPYFLAMAKSISISQFLCHICKSSCSPPSEGPYLSDDSQSTFQYR